MLHHIILCWIISVSPAQPQHVGELPPEGWAPPVPGISTTEYSSSSGALPTISLPGISMPSTSSHSTPLTGIPLSWKPPSATPSPVTTSTVPSLIGEAIPWTPLPATSGTTSTMTPLPRTLFPGTPTSNTPQPPIALPLTFQELQVMNHEINDFINFSTPNNSIVQHYERYCPNNHLCTKSYGSFPDLQKTCCEKCSCSFSCIFTLSCCPDVLEYTPITLTNNYQCVRRELLDILQSKIISGPSMMISKCPETYTNNTIRKQCESHHPYPLTKAELLDLHVPVTGAEIHTVYRNRFCAECNNYLTTDEDFFSLEIKCNRVTRFSFTSFTDLLSNLPGSGCNILYAIPVNRITLMVACDAAYITYCNQTGLMVSYDESLDYMCSSFKSIYDATYRNVFCYLCNEPNPVNITTSCFRDKFDGFEPFHIQSYMAVLSINTDNDALDDRRIDIGEICDEIPSLFFDNFMVSRKLYYAFLLFQSVAVNVTLRLWIPLTCCNRDRTFILKGYVPVGRYIIYSVYSKMSKDKC